MVPVSLQYLFELINNIYSDLNKIIKNFEFKFFDYSLTYLSIELNVK